VDLMLRDAGPLTVFAATDSALRQLPEDCLLSDCLAELARPPAERRAALLDELRAALVGCVAPGRQSIDGKMRGKRTALETLAGRKLVLDLQVATSPNDYTDYVLDPARGGKVIRLPAFPAFPA
jgi:hypothetical protein